MEIHDCRSDAGRREGVRQAAAALRDGKLVVFPTDTVYAIGARAADDRAVHALLSAKHRDADKPASVLVASAADAEALVADLPADARRLVGAFWPGALSLILPAAPTLAWNLGNTAGTVMVRMPADPVALALLAEAGPIAQSSANITGQPPATTCQDARRQLDAAVHTYLDGGPSGDVLPSTIVTLLPGARPVILREGAIAREAVEKVLGEGRLA